MAIALSSAFAIRKSAIASSSLLALSTALGWSGDASAAGTCGAPNGSGVVNCAHKHYANGIDYSGANAVDDLTVNVGSFAGQHHTVTVSGAIVSGGITVDSSFRPSHSTSEALNVGKNVAVVAGTGSGDDAINAAASSYNGSATATVTNKGSLTASAGNGIFTGAYIANASSSQAATTAVTNTGSIHSYNFGIYSEAFAYATTTSATVNNSGAITSAGGGMFNWSHTKYSNAYGAATGTAEAAVSNSGSIKGVTSGIINRGVAYVYGETSASASATSIVDNSGAVQTTSTAFTNYLDAPSAISAVSVAQATSSQTAQAGAVTTVSNSGALSTVGRYGNGIYAQANSYAFSYGASNASAVSQSSVQNSGAIATSGDYTTGIINVAVAHGTGQSSTQSGAYATTNNSGAISTSGAFASAIYSESYASALGTDVTATAITSVTNSGAISTAADNTRGIWGASKAVANSTATLTTISANATTQIGNSGNIATSGDGSSGISATSFASAGLHSAAGGSPYAGIANATAIVDNTGAITTSGAGADGIYGSAITNAYGFRNAYATSSVSITNSGAITTSGGGIVAAAQSYASGAKGCMQCFASGYAIGRSYATVSNSGSVAADGSYVAGISAIASGTGVSKFGSYSYDEAAVFNSGAVTTSGTHSAGVSVTATGYGAFRYFSIANESTVAAVNNSGSISTTGDNSAGIVTTSYAKAVGLQRSVAYANTFITNSGDVSTAGAESADIAAQTVAISEQGNGQVHSTAYITNSGNLAGSGANSSGISSVVAGYSTVPSATYHSSVGYVGTISGVTNSGSIKVSGAYADGIVSTSQAVAQSYYYSNVIANALAGNSGAISASGTGATGIIAVAKAVNLTRPTSYYFSQSAAYTMVGNSGTISAPDGAGIVAVATAQASGGATTAASATTKVLNTGSVTAGAIGIQAYAGAAAYAGTYATMPATATASATLVNKGDVTATAANGIGAFVASLAKTGAGAVASTSTLVNGGTISATGAGGIGAKIEGAYATVLTYTGSTISGGTGAGAAGVYMNGALNTIANSGTITSANDAAIEMSAAAANIIKNSGTITGTVTMATGAKGQNVLYNYGTWNAAGGDSSFAHGAGGDSSFAHGAGGGSNLVNEKGGTIVVVGSQTFEGLDDFTNLGLIDMTQAASAGLGARAAFETLVVSGDYDSIGGALAVNASTVGGMHGDELVIDGAASGTTKIKPRIVGTPGQTTGDGILLVSAHTTAGASNFVLAGNAANGDEVAGAFEYNLAFEPGKDTSGEWFLQSKVYPGVYQFGQTQSAALLVSDQVNPSLDGLMNQATSSTVTNASLDDTSQQVASADSTFVPAPNGNGLSGWGRFDETRFNVDPNGSPLANYKLRVDALQAGLDGTWHNADNLVVFGGYITPFHAWADFASFGGHIGMSGTAYGVYAMWFSGPWAAGLRLNTDNMTAHISDTFIGTSASVKPYERGAQVAVSYDMPLDWADFTPSAEFNYGTVNGVHFTDGAGDLVNVGSTSDVWGKLNGRFSWDVETAHNLLVQPYVNIGLLYRGDTGTQTSISSFSTSTNVNGWDGDFAVGVNTNLAQGLSLSAQADYLAGNRVNGWTGFIGLRYTP